MVDILIIFRQQTIVIIFHLKGQRQCAITYGKEASTHQEIVARGYGKRNPIASNSTKEGRSLNQRVEIKILSIEG